MDKEWFEMAAIRRRRLSAAVWIPLRASDVTEHRGNYGDVGYLEAFFGAGTVAFPVDQRDAVEKLEWSDVGIGHTHGPSTENGKYLPSDHYDSRYKDGPTGLNLVLDQAGYGSKREEWHLHQDLVIALGLFREGDTWACPREGYIDVARLKRKEDGRPGLLEIRAEHLRDYLCARGMGLYVTSYFQRDEITEDASHIDWPNGKCEHEGAGVSWEGRVMAIHEGGGSPFGSSTAVMHVANDSVDEGEDVPTFPLPAGPEASSRQWTVAHEGRKVFRVIGSLWKREWLAPLERSTRVLGDKVPATVSFITDASGKREAGKTLDREGRWLWFKPELVNALLSYRDGYLSWYTRETGKVGVDSVSAVHFGINSIGLINVYAKDVGLLDGWQQQLWAGYNAAPDGKVSGELLASQVKAEPARTKAPEAYLELGLRRLDQAARTITGTTLLRSHHDTQVILERCHRFRGVDIAGVLSLAKDLARLTADSIDTAGINKAPPERRGKVGSLKALENLVAYQTDTVTAREAMAPLFGIYELRVADAHLASSELASTYELVHIDPTSKPIIQAFQMLDTLVGTLYALANLLTRRKEGA